MLETIKKSLLTGVGMALRSKKEIESLAKEFAQQSEMNQDEAKAFLDDCQTKYEQAKSDLDKKIETAIESILKRLDLPSKSDIETLNKRVDTLTQQLEKKD
ncbi:MAG: phasin family protein [Desulfobacter sp.]|nr:phasin family protein [Desulfobacter sp.]WDP85761.1 MAG: phasin family protein [Desulfobacter sp.]